MISVLFKADRNRYKHLETAAIFLISDRYHTECICEVFVIVDCICMDLLQVQRTPSKLVFTLIAEINE